MMHVYMYDIELYNQPTHITNSFIEESSAEDEGRKQEHLHSWGPGLGTGTEQAMHHRTEWYQCLGTLSLCILPKNRILPWFWTQTYIFPYLTQANGVVKCLGPGVEMYSLLDFTLTLVLAGQVV